MHRHVFRRSARLAGVIMVFLLALPLVAQADWVVNDIDMSPDAEYENLLLGDGQSRDVTFRVVPQGGDADGSGTDGIQCNFKNGGQLTVYVNVVNTANNEFVYPASNTVATVNPIWFTMDSCDDEQTIAVTKHGGTQARVVLSCYQAPIGAHLGNADSGGDIGACGKDTNPFYGSGPNPANTTAGTFAFHNARFFASFDATENASASIVINDGDAWTNDPSVSLDLAGTDNVGITRYRLAESQAGLSTATDILVDPAEANFSRDDVPFTLTGDDSDAKQVWLRVYDEEGSYVDAMDAIGLDRTAPEITVVSVTTPTYDPYSGQWTNEDVTIVFECADVGDVQSGIATNNVESPMVVSDEGENQMVSSNGDCVDNAGNSATATSVSNINIDKTPPVVVAPDDIQVTAPSADPIVVNYPDATATDTLSGVAPGSLACEPPSGSLFSVGTTEVVCTAEDLAGNIGTDSFFITVVRDSAQACLYAGQLTQVRALPYGETPSVSCGRGVQVLLYQGLDYFGCVYAGSLTQLGFSEPASCGRGTLISLAAGTDLWGCLYAGALSQVGTSQPASCGRGVMVGFERSDIDV